MGMYWRATYVFEKYIFDDCLILCEGERTTPRFLGEWMLIVINCDRKSSGRERREEYELELEIMSFR